MAICVNLPVLDELVTHFLVKGQVDDGLGRLVAEETVRPAGVSHCDTLLCQPIYDLGGVCFVSDVIKVSFNSGLVAVQPAMVAIQVSRDVPIVSWVEEGDFFGYLAGEPCDADREEVDILVVYSYCDFERVAQCLMFPWVECHVLSNVDSAFWE